MIPLGVALSGGFVRLCGQLVVFGSFRMCRVPGSSGLVNSFRLFQAMDVLRELIDESRSAKP